MKFYSQQKSRGKHVPKITITLEHIFGSIVKMISAEARNTL